MRPLGITLSAYDEFLRAVLMGQLAFGVLFVGVALLNVAVLIPLALPETRQYFETKESAPQIPA